MLIDIRMLICMSLNNTQEFANKKRELLKFERKALRKERFVFISVVPNYPERVAQI